MPSEILMSGCLEASAAEVVAAVKAQGLEGVIAERRSSRYESGKRSGAWVKMRINKGQEPVIGGYVPAGGNFDFGVLPSPRECHLRPPGAVPWWFFFWSGLQTRDIAREIRCREDSLAERRGFEPSVP
jgi:hypothetical protein